MDTLSSVGVRVSERSGSGLGLARVGVNGYIIRCWGSG